MSDLRLTNEERRKVRDGSLKVIRRKIKPYPLAQGQRYVVASTRRVRQIVDREKGDVLHIPPKPNLWITVKGWTLKDGEWEISVSITDERQPVRRLQMGAPAGGTGPGGLKTRAGTKVTHRDGGIAVVEKEVPKKGEEREPWNPETERGYGGADGEEAVDDATLAEFAARAEVPNAAHRDNCRDEDAARAAEEDVVVEVLHGNIPGARAAQRRAERARGRIEERDQVAA